MIAAFALQEEEIICKATGAALRGEQRGPGGAGSAYLNKDKKPTFF